MNARDFITISSGNLRRMKFRASLTISGIVIAIAAFVSMLSFGAGNQRNIEREYDKLGLLWTMQVYPRDRQAAVDTSLGPRLDLAAIERISTIPGVLLAYPFETFTVKVRLGDSTLTSTAQALSSAAAGTRLFSSLSAGHAFATDSSRQAIVSSELLSQAGIHSPDSALGRTMIVSVRASSLDSAIAHLVVDRGVSIIDRMRKIRVDSLRDAAYRSRVLRTELDEALSRFVNGYLNARAEVSDTLTIVGVREAGRMGRLGIEPVIVPLQTAARFGQAGPSGSPTDLLAAATSGRLFSGDAGGNGKTFTRVTVNLDPKVLAAAVGDSIEALGFRTFSFAAQFENIQKAFFYFDLALAVVGLIALVTASLGIVNTMVMSITERRREIGVLKSLGADESDIRTLFLVESGVMGLVGTLLGILSGWVLTRIISFAGQIYMRREGIPVMDLFALPLWLFMLALAVGVGVSLLAGFYPAARAARVDPVAALRND